MIRLIKEISPHQREWRNNSQMMKWTRGSELISETQQLLWLERIENDETIQMFGIESVEEQENVGTCGLTSISMIHRTAEWSLLIDPEQQGKGYATKALELLIDYGFKNLGLNKIWGEIFEANEKCLHIAKKLGFTEEGRRKESYWKEGKFTDSVIVSLLRKEYDRSSRL